MSGLERALEFSRRLAATWSDISFPVVYRQFQGETIDPTEGTITRSYNDIYTRSYKGKFNAREIPVGFAVVERNDQVFHFTADVLTPRSEEDEVYKGIDHLGTISINTGATNVTASSVAWSAIEPGDFIRFDSQATFHRVATIVNASSQLYLSEAYSQATLTGATYNLYRPFQVVGWEKVCSDSEWLVQGRRI
jgi:hypothetical protein